MTSEEYRIELVFDRPLTGQWHCGPNPAWVTVTHLPTMISARSFDTRHHKARAAAMACCQMLVEASRAAECHYPEQLIATSSDAKAMSARQSQDAKQLGPKDASAVGLPICPENPAQKDIL